MTNHLSNLNGPVKLFLFVALGVLTIGLSVSKPVVAQEGGYTRAYADYVYASDQYKKTHADYVVARANYLQSKTIAAQAKAQEATAAMLKARDQVLVTYLVALRTKITETPGLDQGIKDSYYSLLDEEVAWLKNHQSAVTSSTTLSELQAKSAEGRSRLPKTQLVTYKTLLLISTGKLNHFQSEHSVLTTSLQEKLVEIKANGDKDVTVIESRLGEVQGHLTQSEELEMASWVMMDKMKETDSDKDRLFKDAFKKLEDGLYSVRIVNGLVKQVLVSIKTQ